MKQFFIAFACLALTATAANAQSKTTTEKQGLVFTEETHDFGEVPEGPAAEHDFVFVNKGKEPVIITNATSSCGCTVPSWPKEPILPGKSSTIHVSYTTAGKPGAIQKDVFVRTNQQPTPVVLHIRGTVKPKAVTETAGVR